LATAAVWLGLCAYQAARDRFRTWTEVFFLAACVFLAGYAISDFFFFTAATREAAFAAAESSLTTLTFAAYFSMMYGVVLHTRFRHALFLAVVPAAIFLALLPTAVLTDVRAPSHSIGVAWLTVYNEAGFLAWVALLLTYVLLALTFVLLTYREVRRFSVGLSRRLLGVLAGFLVAILLAGFTNTAVTLTGAEYPPLLSSALVLPGILLFLALSPLSERSLTELLRRRKAREYKIQGAFAIFEDGTLIGSEIAPGQDMVDRDLFGATLNVIQNFMQTSFPVLKGKWLKSIQHGDYTLVMEHGRWISSVVVMRGHENDQLRRHIRNLTEEFEDANRTILSNWRGTPKDATGLNVLLAGMLGEV
jgi:hypothetical protein